MVGVAGIEPATFCSQSRRAEPLRYTPDIFLQYCRFREISTEMLRIFVHRSDNLSIDRSVCREK